jgi:hypothetical protein
LLRQSLKKIILFAAGEPLITYSKDALLQVLSANFGEFVHFTFFKGVRQVVPLVDHSKREGAPAENFPGQGRLQPGMAAAVVAAKRYQPSEIQARASKSVAPLMHLLNKVKSECCRCMATGMIFRSRTGGRLRLWMKCSALFCTLPSFWVSASLNGCQAGSLKDQTGLTNDE